MARTFPILALLLCCRSLLPGVTHADYNAHISTQDRSGIEVQATGPYSYLPRTGTFPVKISITNRNTKDLTWHLSAKSSQYSGGNNSITFEKNLHVPRQSSRTFELMLPLAPLRDTATPYYGGWLQYSIEGYSVVGNGYQYLRGNDPKTGAKGAALPLMPFMVFSKSYQNKSADIEKEAQARGRSFAGDYVGPANFPMDWRGFLGAHGIWMSRSDWEELDLSQQHAIKEWVLQGGQLIFTHDSATGYLPPQFDALDPQGTDRQSYGLGTVLTLRGEQDDLASAATILSRSLLLDDGSLANIAAATPYPSHWGLAAGILAYGRQLGPILFLMIAYALIVGPINLFFIAGKERRYRLYITTPLLAAITSVILLGYILIHDGTGGTGSRYILTLLFPAENRALILQEQVSKTGVLLANAFQLPDHSIIQPITFLAQSQPAPIPGRYAHHPAKQPLRSYEFTQSDETLSGDWFLSRSIQSQFIQRFDATRAKLEIIQSTGNDSHADSPEALSSINSLLSELFYRDRGGALWYGENIRPGSPTILKAASVDHYSAWQRRIQLRAGEATRKVLDRVSLEPSFFFALAKDTSEFAIPSHPNIAWRNDHLLVLGKVTLRGGETRT